MGMTLKSISFWDINFKIKEVLEATRLDYFKLKSLKKLSQYRGSLYEIEGRNEFTFEFYRDGNREFITFN